MHIFLIKKYSRISLIQSPKDQRFYFEVSKIRIIGR